jgi:hypothetical protein
LAKSKKDRIKLYEKELKPKEFVSAMEQKWSQDWHLAEEEAVAGRTRSRSRHCKLTKKKNQLIIDLMIAIESIFKK